MEHPSGQPCSTGTPELGPGQEGEGWVLNNRCDTLRHPLVVHTCAQVATRLAQALGSTPLHKCEYLCTHGHGCVCTCGVGWGMENLRLHVTGPYSSQPSAPSCPDPGSAWGRLEAALAWAWAWAWLHIASCIYVTEARGGEAGTEHQLKIMSGGSHQPVPLLSVNDPM